MGDPARTGSGSITHYVDKCYDIEKLYVAFQSFRAKHKRRRTSGQVRRKKCEPPESTYRPGDPNNTQQGYKHFSMPKRYLKSYNCNIKVYLGVI